MVFVVIKYWYPSHKQEEVAKIFQKNVETPPNIVGKSAAFAVKGSKKGYVGMNFIKVTKEQVGQAYNAAATLLGEYAGIEGYEAKIEVWGDVTEKLAV